MTDYDRAFEIAKIGMDYCAGDITAEQATDSAIASIAAIRVECADRAVAWCKKWAEFPMGNHGTSALRAAIEGQNTIKMNGKTYSYNPEPDVVGEPVGAGEPLDALKAAIEGGQE